MSPNSNIVFNGGSGGTGGVLQSSGILGLSTGTAGGGKIQWTHNSGGFAAQGGPLTVTLDSGGTETWGVAPFNVSGGLIFGSPTADNPVTFTNSIILNAGNRNIYVNPGVGGNGADYALISGNLIVASGDTTSQITKEGNGLLILAGSNSYPGATTITAGTLQIGNGGNSGTLGSGAVSNSGALVFDRSDSGLILPNAISGTGSLALIGSGIVTLTGANTYTGPTTVAAGTLRLGTGGSLGATSITVAPGATLNAWSGTNVSGSLTLLTSGTLPAGLDLTDGQIGSFNLAGGLTVPSGTTAAQLTLELGSSGNSDEIDQINVNSLSLSGSAVVNISPLAGTTVYTGSYSFLTSTAGGVGGSNLSLASSTISGSGGATYTLALNTSGGTAEVLVISAGSTSSSNGTWNIAGGGSWNLANQLVPGGRAQQGWCRSGDQCLDHVRNDHYSRRPADSRHAAAGQFRQRRHGLYDLGKQHADLGQFRHHGDDHRCQRDPCHLGPGGDCGRKPCRRPVQQRRPANFRQHLG